MTRKGAIPFSENMPILLAEEVPMRCIDRYYSSFRYHHPYGQLWSNTQYLLEASLSGRHFIESDCDYDILNENLEVLTERRPPYADRALPELYLGAVILKAQIEVFDERRQFITDISRDAIDEAHEDTVRLLAFHSRPSLKITYSRRAEIELMALCSRLGEAALFPYTTTAREERNDSCSPFNHDFYFIQNNKKVPIQVKSERTPKCNNYDSSVLVVVRNELDDVVPGLGVSDGEISRLLLGEVIGKLNRGEWRQLDILSRYVLDKVQEHNEANLQ